MNDKNPDILVRRFLDDDLSADEVQAALHRIADDPEARDLLRFEVQMTQDLSATRSAQPPQDFAETTMASLPPDAAPSAIEQMRTWWTLVTRPVALTVRPVSATLVTLLAGMVLMTLILWNGDTAPPGASSTDPVPSASSERSASVRTASSVPRDETAWIRFTYTNSEADSVAVAGDFSQWEPIPLSPRNVNGKVVWTGLVPVTRGEHEYQFVINGEQWVADPLAPMKRSDGFGAENAVLEL